MTLPWDKLNWRNLFTNKRKNHITSKSILYKNCMYTNVRSMPEGFTFILVGIQGVR